MIAGSGLTSLGVAKSSSFCAIVISKGQNISSTLMIYQYFGLNQAVLHAKYFPLVQPQKEKEKKLIKKKREKDHCCNVPLVQRQVVFISIHLIFENILLRCFLLDSNSLGDHKNNYFKSYCFITFLQFSLLNSLLNAKFHYILG